MMQNHSMLRTSG